MAAPVDPIIKIVRQESAPLPPSGVTDVNLAEVGGVATAVGAGNSNTGTQRVVVATDQAVLPVGGNVASGAADSGNPVKVGGVSSLTGTAVSVGQRGDFQLTQRSDLRVVSATGGGDLINSRITGADGVSNDAVGYIIYTRPSTFNGTTWDRTRGTASGESYSVPGGLSAWSYAAASGGIINNTELSVKAAAGAGIRNYITWLTLHNVSATGTEFVVLDGSAGTVLWRGYAIALATGASFVSFPSPLKTTANTAVYVQCITTGTQTYVNLGGYTAP